MPKNLYRQIAVLIVLLLLALMWRYLSDEGLVTASRLASFAERLSGYRQSPWAVPGIVLTYVVALLLMFPLTLLVIVTALLFGPSWGLLYATLGTLSSSAVTFWVGHWMGREAIERYGGHRVNQLSGYLGNRSIRAMVIINLLPLAPFTFTNLMAGAFNMPFGRYLLGSAIGIIPGLALVTVLGGQINSVLTTDGLNKVWPSLGIAAIIVIIILVFGKVLRNQPPDDS